jgi:hypothetical protein
VCFIQWKKWVKLKLSAQCKLLLQHWIITVSPELLGCMKIFRKVYFIYYGNEGASSSVSDVDRYVIVGKLLDAVLSILPEFIRRWGIKTYLDGTFLP